MKIKIFPFIVFFIFLFGIAFFFLSPNSPGRLINSAPELPGNISNPKLASMINTEIDKELATIAHGAFYADIKPESVAASREWLQQIESATMRCRYGPGGPQRFNRIEYDIVLKNQAQAIIKDIYTGTRCSYDPVYLDIDKKPLIMKVIFKDGKAVDAFTDGRELNSSPQDFVFRLRDFSKKILGEDQKRRPQLYYKANLSPTPAQIQQEWKN